MCLQEGVSEVAEPPTESQDVIGSEEVGKYTYLSCSWIVILWKRLHL